MAAISNSTVSNNYYGMSRPPQIAILHNTIQNHHRIARKVHLTVIIIIIIKRIHGFYYWATMVKTNKMIC